MNKRVAGIVLAVIVVVVGVVVVVALGGSDKPASKTNTDTSTNTSTQTNQQAQATNSVNIKDFAFEPATITVKVGTKVTWTNQDSVGHTVTADSGAGPDSQLIDQGQSYSFTFDKAGTYTYHCAPHPYMKGTVVVTE